MTFDDFPLYAAIHDVYGLIDSPRAGEWMIVPSKRDELCRRIRNTLPLDKFYSPEAMMEAFQDYGKNNVAPGIKKSGLTVDVARRFGLRCFWAGRVSGECSNVVTLDRIIPGARGGVYEVFNCVIACSFHNSMRNDRSVEQFLQAEHGTQSDDSFP